MSDFSIKRILIPVDFSEPALHALRYGRDLATNVDADVIVLLYVVEPAVYPAELGITVSIEGDLVERAQTELDKLVEKEFSGQNVETRVATGVADARIVETASSESCDLIVMGTHGYGGIKHMLLGSTAERVVRSAADVPVLTVRAAH